MKDYIKNGLAYDVELDNGKKVKVASKYIDNLCEKLDITTYDAIMTYLEDEGHIKNEEQEETIAKAKKNKVALQAKSETPKKKTQKERVKKDNPIKEKIIAEIVNKLKENEEISNIIVENVGKIVTFSLNGEDFKIDLIQKRKPKQ